MSYFLSGVCVVGMCVRLLLIAPLAPMVLIAMLHMAPMAPMALANHTWAVDPQNPRVCNYSHGTYGCYGFNGAYALDEFHGSYVSSGF